MFNVITQPTFSRTVKVRVPKGDGSEVQSFRATFRAIDDEEAEGISFLKVSEVKAHLRKIIVSFDDLCDEQGQPITYSEDIRENMLARSYVRIALLETYAEALTQERLGN
ncbi:hypothetical protein [Phaeobacter inhibens]|uniref:hypothetical protein n=1 Tax=Phaeobacter inhibens TaxID=221822 RepID=UPI00076BB9F8|nr:hypothetical protein [Phaeobacter inhibens]KXF92088.1 hypothetical protein AT574_03795 [Phaeobacter inhibens]WHP69923.1 hypothetical protein QMZ01_07045 [Phaeobacter inhibens]